MSAGGRDSWRGALTRLVAIGLAAPLAGCSLVWTPIHPDGGPDAFGPDGGTDAPVPDAWNAPDAWPPPEICSVFSGGRDVPEGQDNDHDGLYDCGDPDCYGNEVCCSESAGVALGGAFMGTIPPTGWEHPNTSIRSGSTDHVILDFGSSGYLRRRACTPLAAGARLDLDLRRVTGVAEGDLSIVLTPADAPSATGFLDEIGLHFDAAGGSFRVTRAGRDEALPGPSECPEVLTDPTHYDLDSPSRVTVEVRPGVVGERSVMLVNVEVFGSFGACTSVRPVVDAAIEMRDLVRTTEGRAESCDESPGLYVVLAGHGTAFEIGTEITLQRFECASPAVFAVERPILVRADLSTTVPGVDTDFAAGGIGAPDLDHDGTDWWLTYDGARQDRSSEIFQHLDLRLGQSTSSNFLAWVGEPDDDGVPVAVTGTGLDGVAIREPSGRATSMRYVFAGRRGTSDDFDLYQAVATGGAGRWAGSILALPPECSWREPALSDGPGGSHWVLARCDDTDGTDSRLDVLRLTSAGEYVVGSLASDLLAMVAPAIAHDVRAVDVLSRAAGGQRYVAVWILAETGGSRSLHLFAGSGPEDGTTFPALVPYAGNPVLEEADLDEECTGACEITSFGVGLDSSRAGPGLLRFLFARTRATDTATVYEFVPRTQFAPSALSGP
ncbi:MAG: hypothetical protein K1X94_31895 [Sandaracinaceae bacterium]|nr:hypothetical protein [Sandaracinaceae bacterium]